MLLKGQLTYIYNHVPPYEVKEGKEILIYKISLDRGDFT